MSTAGNSRTLRSASKTRSEASVAPSSRGTRSRRASPVVPDITPLDEQNEVPFSLQSYGASGKPAAIQLQAAQIAKQQALDPILKAVAEAEASDGGASRNAGGLAPVVEADETNLNAGEGSSGNRLPRFAQTPEASSLFTQNSNTLWAPHHPDQGTEVEQDAIRRHQGRSYLNTVNVNLTKYMILALLVLIFGVFGYKLPSIVAYVAEKTTYLPASAGNTGLGDITVHDYLQLKRRVEKVEQRLHNQPRFSSPSASTIDDQINWFTPGFEPAVDVEMSSPTTTRCDPSWKPYPFSSMFWQKCPEIPLSPPHMMALQKWDDPGDDQWCAPKSGGKLQLAVEIKRPILPTQLVVEYMALQASPKFYMTMAPKEVELWIRVEDDDLRWKIGNAIHNWHPELWENSSPQGKELHGVRELSHEYVPVGRWIYNIYDKTHIQGFNILTPLLELGVSTDKFIIRVNSNWGNKDYTCINRLRMHGVDMSGIVDYLEEDAGS